MKKLFLNLTLILFVIPFGISQQTTDRNSNMIVHQAMSEELNTAIRDSIGTLIESNSTNSDNTDSYVGFESQVEGVTGRNYAINASSFGNSNYRNYGVRGAAKNGNYSNTGVLGISTGGEGFNYAVWGVASESTGQNRGVIGYATQPTAGQNYGVTGWVGGSVQFNIALGGYADAAD